MRRLAFLAAALLAVSSCSDDGGSEPAPKIILKPFTATGQALTAPAKTWTWIDFPDTQCRDGSMAGIAVSLNPASTNLMIYLEGGGACFDQLSCAITPPNADVWKAEKKDGLFARSNPENPVGDWNWVYVPYCTGDTHAGDNRDVMIDGVGLNQFVGYANMKKYLNRVVPTLPNPSNVLLTGISAGGFGAAQNALLVQAAFPNVPVKLIDDSGPPLSTAVIPQCLQTKWRTLWGLDKTYLADCGEACAAYEDDFVQPLALAMANTFSDRPAGLIESTRDAVISRFFGAGLDNCTGTALLSQVPAELFSADLAAFRELLEPFPKFGTWTPDGERHTWIAGSDLYTANIGGKRLVEWVRDIIEGRNPGNYGP
ncbi:MAG TPA: pectin acetylesterase-family hydrolase [Polyangiales bacterium]|nr:pectin acetylesterase-family hydrolase [Polyangiales bacterium]